MSAELCGHFNGTYIVNVEISLELMPGGVIDAATSTTSFRQGEIGDKVYSLQ